MSSSTSVPLDNSTQFVMIQPKHIADEQSNGQASPPLATDVATPPLTTEAASSSSPPDSFPPLLPPNSTTTIYPHHKSGMYEVTVRKLLSYMKPPHTLPIPLHPSSPSPLLSLSELQALYPALYKYDMKDRGATCILNPIGIACNPIVCLMMICPSVCSYGLVTSQSATFSSHYSSLSGIKFVPTCSCFIDNNDNCCFWYCVDVKLMIQQNRHPLAHVTLPPPPSAQQMPAS